jgi:parallel beta-helix repeat protein
VAEPIPADPYVYDARAHGLTGDGDTNDQPALQELVDKLGDAYEDDRRPRVIYCPSGVYAIQDRPTVWRSGVSLIGAGPAATTFALANPGDPTAATPLAFFTSLQHGAGCGNHIADCTFAHFEIDGSGMILPEYNVYAKGLGLQYVLRGRFYDLYIHDTPATGFGCDFLQDSWVKDLLVVHCGRLEHGKWLGGAGIGIGTGGWGLTERCTVSDCITVRNGTNGIFFELQNQRWPTTRGIRVMGCHSEGNQFGISDWGMDGLIVANCTLIGNHQAGYDVSALGTSAVAGRGGIITGCVIENNAWDGIAIGNTPGPYTVSNNRISRNGRYGYWQHNLSGGIQEPSDCIAIDGNEFRDNGLDGILIASSVNDIHVVGNKIRNNGRQAEPATSGGGESVFYTDRSLIDTSANWRPNGHVGKWVTAGAQQAIVLSNDETELALAPLRPGATTAWLEGTPSPGAPYRLPDAPAVRAGITLAAAAHSPSINDNRVWDSQARRTQTHAFVITDEGSCATAWVHDNEFATNAIAPVRFDREPTAGCWYHNHGLDGCPTDPGTDGDNRRARDPGDRAGPRSL